jgi:glycosyltransferase involved in cell wall biosynthesis
VNALTDANAEICLVTVNSGVADLVIPKCELLVLDRPWHGGLRTILSAYFKLQKKVKKWNPEVIVLNCDAPELLGALLIGDHQIVVVEHSSNPWVTRKTLGKAVRAILRLRGAKWIAVSSHLKIWPNDLKPATSIPNAIHVRRKYQNEGILISRENYRIKRLVYVGRLSSEKQPDWVLEVAQKTDLPSVFFGDGGMKDSLTAKSIQEGITATFPGFVNNPWNQIGLGDLLIIPSMFEGDGLVLVESLAHCVPLLANAVPDLLRFKLPTKHYCKSPSEFKARILEYSEKLEELVVPEETSLKLLQRRTPVEVARRWIDFLNTLT